jgi:hypothetical protein
VVVFDYDLDKFLGEPGLMLADNVVSLGESLLIFEHLREHFFFCVFVCLQFGPIFVDLALTIQKISFLRVLLFFSGKNFYLGWLVTSGRKKLTNSRELQVFTQAGIIRLLQFMRQRQISLIQMKILSTPPPVIHIEFLERT